MFAKDKQSSIMKKESKQLRELSEEELRKVTGGDVLDSEIAKGFGGGGNKECNQTTESSSQTESSPVTASLLEYNKICYETPISPRDPGVGPIAF